jgi:hypothetical protein
VAPAVVPIVPTVMSADPPGPNRSSFPSMLPPGLLLLATCDTLAGSRPLPCASACIETRVWPRKMTAMTATIAYGHVGRLQRGVLGPGLVRGVGDDVAKDADQERGNDEGHDDGRDEDDVRHARTTLA